MKCLIVFLGLLVSLNASVASADTFWISFSGSIPVQDPVLANKIGSSIRYAGDVLVDDRAGSVLSEHAPGWTHEYYPFQEMALSIAGHYREVQMQDVNDWGAAAGIQVRDAQSPYGDAINAIVWSNHLDSPLKPITINGRKVDIEYAWARSEGPHDALGSARLEESSKWGSDALFFNAFELLIRVDGQEYYLIDTSSIHTVQLVEKVGKGYAVFIDGMKPVATFLDFLPDAWSSYLYDSVPSWLAGDLTKNVGKIWQFSWSNDTGDTPDTVVELSAHLEILSQLARERDAPFVILAHSWGSVLAFAAIKLNNNIIVDRFITLGSPLDSQTAYLDSYTNVQLSFLGLSNNITSKPRNVKSWINYWYECDAVSGPIQRLRSFRWIDATGIDNVELGSGGILVGCHSDYFEDYSDWRNILSEAAGN